MRKKSVVVLGFLTGLILCATLSFADDNSGFFGRYDLQFSIEDCSSHSFVLVLGDDMSLVNGFGGDPDLVEYYVYIPATESSATYTFVDAEGDTLERTVSISGDTVTMHEELQGYYTGHFVFTFSAVRNSFTISGYVDEEDPEAECEGAVSGTGTRIIPCECDMNGDGRCDMRDWLLFGQRWGATDCSTAYCACDLNADGRCDMRDWLVFGQDWGRTDCPCIAFNRTYGGSSNENAYAVQQTSDSGYILAGGTNSFGSGMNDVWLVKTDANGKRVWAKTFGGSAPDKANAVQQTRDGGYIVAGETYSYGAGSTDFWLIKTDALGNRVWDKTFGGFSDEDNSAVLQTLDGGYILVGQTSSFGAGGSDIWLIKTDADGNRVWDRTYGGTGTEYGYSVKQTTDGGYIIAGGTASFGAGSMDVWLIKTDGSGNMVWDSTFGGISSDEANAVQQTGDGGYIIAGETYSYGSGGGDCWLIKTDAGGNMVWDETFGGQDDEEAIAMQQTSDGGYILAGETYSFGAGSRDALLIKTDASGTKVWDKVIGGINSDFASAVQQTRDGGFVLAGETRSYGSGGVDFWLIKTDANGNAPATPAP